MLGKTHKVGGCLAMLISFSIMQKQNLLIDNINPLVQLMVMYPACSWGSTASDLDQNDNAIPEKTPFSILIHKVLSLVNCKHRSWQTHSLGVTGVFCVLCIEIVALIEKYDLMTFESINILRLIITGFSVGILSHLLLDSITMAGIYLLPGIPFRLVPKSKTFGTGTTYEVIVRYVLYVGLVGVLLFTRCLGLF